MTRPVGSHDDVRTTAAARIHGLVPGSGLALEDFLQRVPDCPSCPVLDFAASGAMWLTGDADGPPIAPEAPVMAHVRAMCAGISLLAERIGNPVNVDAHQVVSQRAGYRGFRRQGSTSANGSCRLVPGDVAWLAVSLPRRTDLDLLPAAVGSRAGDDPWEAVRRAARRLSAPTLVEQAQLVGIAAAQLAAPDKSSGAAPFRMVPLGSAAQHQRGKPLVVIDFSALWAGPLCARVLGATGASVIKVEDPSRPDAARVGDPRMFRMLHTGHRIVQSSFSTDEGVRRVRQLVEAADVVVESSRPRALAQLGLSPEKFLSERPGRTWVSITGYGRSGARANYVAFGDDAAVSGGLVGWSGSRPVFCADAVADPLSGLFAAIGSLFSIAVGGGLLIDVSMSGACAFVCRGPACPAPHGVERDAAGGWYACHAGERQLVVPPVRVPT